MPTVFHTGELEFETKRARVPEFAWQTSARLAQLAGAKQLEFDIRALDPGRFSFPYHFHRAAEELFLVISGQATLRTPEGFQTLYAGDLVFFEPGETGTHQLYNHGDAPCVYLDIRTTMGIDVVEYPDSGKLAILPRLEVFETHSRVGYHQGEENVADRWPEEILQKPPDA
jgi:uncharacterized cupin superfamily protein